MALPSSPYLPHQRQAVDEDPTETNEWLDALQGTVGIGGLDRAHYLIERLIGYVHMQGELRLFSVNTPYLNTITREHEPEMPGDRRIEERIRAYTQWNAMAMVLRAAKHTNVGGHIASFASAATLYEVGFNHFWRAPTKDHDGDLLFTQGHCSAVSDGVNGIGTAHGACSGTCLPKATARQFPTASMGLGPLMALVAGPDQLSNEI